jgi:hypothetical protein
MVDFSKKYKCSRLEKVWEKTGLEERQKKQTLTGYRFVVFLSPHSLLPIIYHAPFYRLKHGQQILT